MTYEEAVAQLTGPGAPFEIAEESVGGRSQRNFKNREKNLREKIVNAGLRGDRDCLVQGERRIGYAEFSQRVFGAGHALRDGFGLRRGDRLAILAYNSPDWLITHVRGEPPSAGRRCGPERVVVGRGGGVRPAGFGEPVSGRG